MAYRMTAARKAALRKAQAASARKRRGKGKGRLRRGARKVASGYKKYDRAVTRTKSKAKRKATKIAKKYPRTTTAIKIGSVVGAAALNYSYYKNAPMILGPHGHPVPNPFYRGRRR